MRKLSLLFVMVAMLLVALMPVSAQSEVDIDGDLVLTAFVENIIVFYPENMYRLDIEDKEVVRLAFNEAGTDVISIFTTSRLTALGVDQSALVTVATGLYDLGYEGIGADSPRTSEFVEFMVGGIFPAYFVEASNETTYFAAEIISVFGDYYVLSLTTENQSGLTAADQLYLMGRIRDAMMVDDMVLGVSDMPSEFPTPDVSALVAELQAKLQTRPLPIEARELTQIVTNAEGTLRVSLPASWIAMTDFAFMVSTSQETLDKFNDISIIYEPEEISLQFVTSDLLGFFGVDIPDALTTIALLNFQFENDADVFQYEALNEEGFSIYYTPLTSEFVPKGAFVMVVETGSTPAEQVIIVGVTGDFELNEATLIAIANSLGYVVAEESE